MAKKPNYSPYFQCVIFIIDLMFYFKVKGKDNRYKDPVSNLPLLIMIIKKTIIIFLSIDGLSYIARKVKIT